MTSLFIFVEGLDDERFISEVIVPRLLKVYDQVDIHRYRNKTEKYVSNFISSIKSMSGVNYMFISDFDMNPCISTRKDRLIERYDGLDKEHIFIVKNEIESWYVAGLDRNNCSKFRIKHFTDTVNVTKNSFDEMFNIKSKSRVDLMLEILVSFDSRVARKQNSSFDYFFRKTFDRD